jgi:NAD(P)-dependent dehydrogenase (short-subunit alcohol dehydrogenase family)
MAEGTVIVTGASKGIGAAIAVELERRGHAVVGLSRSGTVPAGEGRVCDMGDEAAVRAAFADIAAAGPIAGLVNNAGQYAAGPSHTLETAEYERVMALDATAVMVACREVYPYLKAGGGGKIVNIGSFFDKLGVSEHLAYCAAKAAVGAITRCLAVEWAGEGIGVMNVAPGYIATDLNKDFTVLESAQAWFRKRIPVGRCGTAEEVARLVAALIAEDIPFLQGETIYIDGGQGIYHS